MKRSTGWSATNVGLDGEAGDRFGAQLLTRPIPLLPWRFAYAPRGPLADEWNESTHQAWLEALRAAARPGGPLARTAIVRMDPEIEDAEPIQRALAGSGWRRAHDRGGGTTLNPHGGERAQIEPDDRIVVID